MLNSEREKCVDEKSRLNDEVVRIRQGPKDIPTAHSLMKNMKKVLARTIGFLLATLIPVVYLHLASLPSWTALLDGILSSLVFTLPFGWAVWWCRKGTLPDDIPRASKELVIGLVAGAFRWSLLWGVWSVVPEPYHASAESWAFYSHLLAALGTGWLSLRFGKDGSLPERAEQNMPSPFYCDSRVESLGSR